MTIGLILVIFVISFPICWFHNSNRNRATRVEVRYGSIFLQNETFLVASRFIEHPEYNSTTLVIRHHCDEKKYKIFMI